MPYTKSGKYYKIVNGHRQYNPKFNKAPTVTGRGAYNIDRSYKRTKATRKVAKTI